MNVNGAMDIIISANAQHCYKGIYEAVLLCRAARVLIFYYRPGGRCEGGYGVCFYEIVPVYRALNIFCISAEVSGYFHEYGDFRFYYDRRFI